MLQDVIDECSLPDPCSNNIFMGFSDFLFSFAFVCDICGLKPSSYGSSCVTYNAPMQELIMQEMQQKYKSHIFDRNTSHIESNHILQLPKYVIIIFRRLSYVNTTATKICVLYLWPLFTQPFIRAQIKQNMKAPPHWPLCGDSPGTGEFPSQSASNAEIFSIWWRHHVIWKLNAIQISRSY